MAKGKDLPSYIHRRKRDGVLLFRKRSGKSIVEIKLETQFPECEPVPFALHQERERLLNEPTPVQGGRDFAAVTRHYSASRKYSDLKPRTRHDYDPHISFLADKIGHIEPRHIERRHVISWLDAWAKKETPHKANYRLRVLRLLLEHAIDMGLIGAGQNPAKGVSEIKYEKRDREPWPDIKVAAFRKAYPYGTRERTLFEMCLGTGQRIGDVLKMQWQHIDGGAIRLTQGKTGKRLEIPLTPHLRAALEHTPRESLFILSKDMSKTKTPGPWAYRGAADAMRAARDAVGASEYDLHALRYTAAVELLLSGCDDDLIASVTGQSLAMVRHYTRHVRQRVRAQEAQKRRG